MLYTSLDRAIIQFDRALRTLSNATQPATRPSPALDHQEQSLSDHQRLHSAGLMRVNHSGEVCAQALYQGQSLTAKLPTVRSEMELAADEEIDHLAWCEERLLQLQSHTSLLNPIWYGLSFGLGAGAGLISDKTSLGFVAATEEQVSRHLQDHLKDLPENDQKSRAIVGVMLEDEQEHGQAALRAGGRQLPTWVRKSMWQLAKLMTFSSYRV